MGWGVGMFFTGGMDGLVKCWDTEGETVIHNFDNKSKVHSPTEPTATATATTADI